MAPGRGADVPSVRLSRRLHQASDAADSATTTAKLRPPLSKQLEEYDRQEDRFLDLIGHPYWPQDKIKTRLQKVRESKRRIAHQIATTAGDLEPGRAVLIASLELLDRPHDLYDNATDDARKLLNKAIFTRLYVNSTDRKPIATEETLSEPFGSLVNAVRATDGARSGAGRPKPIAAPKTPQNTLRAYLHSALRPECE